jgi:hypothetical protein
MPGERASSLSVEFLDDLWGSSVFFGVGAATSGPERRPLTDHESIEGCTFHTFHEVLIGPVGV